MCAANSPVEAGLPAPTSGEARWTPVANRFLNDLGFSGTMPRP